jgi:hypothetical protein
MLHRGQVHADGVLARDNGTGIGRIVFVPFRLLAAVSCWEILRPLAGIAHLSLGGEVLGGRI